MPLSLTLAVAHVVQEYYFSGYQNKLLFFVVLVICLWSTCFIRCWERFEKELAYCFDTYGYERTEPERLNVRGRLVVDKVTGLVTRGGVLTSFWKRRMVRDYFCFEFLFGFYFEFLFDFYFEFLFIG